jgi:hypothetical protein
MTYRRKNTQWIIYEKTYGETATQITDIQINKIRYTKELTNTHTDTHIDSAIGML